jgi:hypothetical protein
MSNFMTVAERVVYKMCPHNPAQTLAVKEAWVESRFYGLGSAIKSFGIERFKHNTVRVSLFFLLINGCVIVYISFSDEVKSGNTTEILPRVRALALSTPAAPPPPPPNI